MAGKTLQTFRLPKDIVPVHYDLYIYTDLEEHFLFTGTEKIQIKCLHPTRTIKIHIRELKIPVGFIPKVMEVKDQGRALSVILTTMDEENDFYVINTLETLVEGQEYSLLITFEGKLKENLIGFYRSKYLDWSSNETKWLAVTHFEPSNARQAFPCFDEPGMKATFKIRLGHHERLQAVSNMPLEARKPHESSPNYIWSEFKKTIPMSTYLVGYMISEFDFVKSDPQPNNITFRVWARKEALKQTSFAATVGPQFLNYYEDFFGVKYPLPKQDLLAIPDFKIGAMENWGIITFRESALLLDDKSTSTEVKLNSASTIAHELAHMWFGNLVTIWWWTDLWLKEGFATYMAGLSVHHAFPEWNSLDPEALSDLLRVFHLDSLKSSHPVSVPINHPKEVGQIFDAISYAKGSFLLRMISQFLGEEVFRHGVTEYLKKHQYGNAEQDDLWASLTTQAHRYSVLPPEVSVKQIMDTWTLQTGYPLLTVERNHSTGAVTVSQKKYLATKSENEADYSGSWWIPLSYSTETEPNFNLTQPEHWLAGGQETRVLDFKVPPEQWIIFNNRAAGLYRVNYDEETWNQIIKTLKSDKFEVIDVMNRALLIIDSMDLANSGIIKYEIPISLIDYMSRESAFVPWSALLAKLEPLKAKLTRTAAYGDFLAFLKTLLQPIVQSITSVFEESSASEPEPVSFEKGRLLNLISRWATPHFRSLQTRADAQFHAWRFDGNYDIENNIWPDFRHAVYSYVVEVGGEDVWNFLWGRYLRANIATEKNNILMALTNARQVWLINRYLEWTLDETSGIRKQDAFLIFRVTAAKDLGFAIAQKFFFRNVKRISEYFGANSDLIGHYISAIADQMIYPYEYEELKEFSEKYKDLLAPANLTVKQALETVQLNVRWMEKHYGPVSRTLAKFRH